MCPSVHLGDERVRSLAGTIPWLGAGWECWLGHRPQESQPWSTGPFATDIAVWTCFLYLKEVGFIFPTSQNGKLGQRRVVRLNWKSDKGPWVPELGHRIASLCPCCPDQPRWAGSPPLPGPEVRVQSLLPGLGQPGHCDPFCFLPEA